MPSEEYHMDLSVMISHASMDATIATAWQRLLRRVFPEAKLRYSSDPRDPAFSGYGAFAEEILDWIRQSRYILTIQTPNSAFRPWLVWEAGMARALQKGMFVVVYGVKPGQLRNPLDSEPQYEGVTKSDVHKIVRGSRRTRGTCTMRKTSRRLFSNTMTFCEKTLTSFSPSTSNMKNVFDWSLRMTSGKSSSKPV